MEEHKKRPEAPDVEHGRDALSREILEDYRKIKGCAPGAFHQLMTTAEKLGKLVLTLNFLFILYWFFVYVFQQIDYTWLFERLSS